MIKHFCDLCGKEIPLKSSIINYIPASDLPPRQYDVCKECEEAFAYFVHKLKIKKENDDGFSSVGNDWQHT